MKRSLSYAVLWFLSVTLLFQGARSVSYSVVQCQDEGRDEQQGVLVSMTEAEFFSSYNKVFQMSDSSRVQQVARGYDSLFFRESLNYTQTLLDLVGITTTPNADSGQRDLMSFRVCGQDMTSIFFLSIIGNFVNPPSDVRSYPQSSSDSLPNIVVDVYTGKLALVHSFSSMKTYFLETIVVVSTLAIAKLSIVQSVVVPTK